MICTTTFGLSCSFSRADVKDLPRYNIKVQWSFIHISNNFKPVNFSHALYLVIKSFNPFLMGSRQFLGHGCACSEYKRVLVYEFVSPNTMFIGLGTTLSAQGNKHGIWPGNKTLCAHAYKIRKWRPSQRTATTECW